MPKSIQSESIFENAPNVKTIKSGDDETISYHFSKGKAPGVIFLGGFASNMTGTKALALELARQAIPYISVGGCPLGPPEGLEYHGHRGPLVGVVTFSNGARARITYRVLKFTDDADGTAWIEKYEMEHVDGSLCTRINHHGLNTSSWPSRAAREANNTAQAKARKEKSGKTGGKPQGATTMGKQQKNVGAAKNFKAK